MIWTFAILAAAAGQEPPALPSPLSLPEALRIFRERGFDLLLFVLDLSIYWTAVAQLELAVGKELRQ